MRYSWTLEREGRSVSGGPKDWPNSKSNLVWYWTGGNYGCDCNRSLLFGGEEMECGEGAFRAKITVEGEVLLDEQT